MYTIKVEYTTGDSFGSFETTGEVELQWETKEAAQKAMMTIQAHYKAYCEISYHWRQNTADISAYKKEPWFAESSEDWNGPDSWKYSIILPDNEGVFTWRIYPFWCGYFERLNALKVIAVGNDNMRIEF